MEKELIVLVTPELVSPLYRDEVPPFFPGSDVTDPTNWEFYVLNQFEGRGSGSPPLSAPWDNPGVELLRIEQQNVVGPVGFSQ